MAAQTFNTADYLDDIAAVIDTARAAVQGSNWDDALEDGYNMLVQRNSFIYDVDGWELTTESANDPGVYYVANGACKCKAGPKKTPCWHRAAAKLLRRAFEYRAVRTQQAPVQQRPPVSATVRKARLAEALAAVDELFA